MSSTHVGLLQVKLLGPIVQVKSLSSDSGSKMQEQGKYLRTKIMAAIQDLLSF